MDNETVVKGHHAPKLLQSLLIRWCSEQIDGVDAMGQWLYIGGGNAVAQTSMLSTPNVHFSALSTRPCSVNLKNNRRKWRLCSTADVLATRMSSM